MYIYIYIHTCIYNKSSTNSSNNNSDKSLAPRVPLLDLPEQLPDAGDLRKHVFVYVIMCLSIVLFIVCCLFVFLFVCYLFVYVCCFLFLFGDLRKHTAVFLPVSVKKTLLR